MIRRRTFLQAAAALALAPRPLFAATPIALTAAPSRARIAPEGYPETEIWAFDNLSPGPEIRIAQGARVTRRLINSLPQPTTIHWHGIRIDNAMDGVPDMTQAAVAPGESFDYDFAVPDAGTYWYHSHMKAHEQVERGLYGVLVVEEPDAPEVDADHVLVLDDWRLDDSAAITSDFDNGHDLAHNDRIGNVVTTNGEMDFRLDVKAGDRLRLRLINTANGRIFTLGLKGLAGWVAAVDGMPLAAPRAVAGPFSLAPAQRVDLIVDIATEAGSEAFLLDIVRNESFAQATFRVGPGGAPRAAAPRALPPNPSFGEPDRADARAVEVRMEGGAMRWLASAEVDGVVKDGRTLAADGIFWALSGKAGHGHQPLIEAARGEAIRLDFVNDTMWDHAMHLHGHHFREVAPDGSLGDFRDTTLVRPGETRPVVFVAHNPGGWLLHCHMLGHHAAGMGTWIRVA